MNQATKALPPIVTGKDEPLRLFAIGLPVIAGLLPAVLALGAKAVTPCFVLLGLLAIVDLVRSGDWRRPLGRTARLSVALFCGLLAWGLASVVWEYTSGLALHKTGQLVGLTLLGLPIVLAATHQDRKIGARTLVAVCCGLTATLALLAVERIFGLPLAHFRYGVPVAMGALHMDVYKNLATAGGVFAVPAIGFALMRRRWLMAGVMTISIFTAALLSNSSTALVSLAAVTGLAVAGLVSRRLAALLLAVGLVAGFSLAPPATLRLPDTLQVTQQLPWLPSSLVHRTAIWRFVAENAVQRPVAGWGLDASRELPGGDANITVYAHFGGKIYPNAQQILPLHPHNFVMQLWLELGGIGMGIFLAMLLALLRLALAQKGQAATVCVAALATPVLVGTASYGLWQTWWVSCLWLAVALVAALVPKDEGCRGNPEGAQAVDRAG